MMAFSLAPVKIPSSFTCRAIVTSSSSPSSLSFDAANIKRAAALADKSSGLTAPHPNFGCIIASTSGSGESVVVGEGYLYAQGTSPSELLAVEAAGERCRGATAYLNMEPNHYLRDRNFFFPASTFSAELFCLNGCLLKSRPKLCNL
ncbi:hypothetical protein ACS0TY_025012 [Phlomoides rotata]